MTILMKKSSDPKLFMMKGMNKGMMMNKGKSPEIKSMVMYDSEDEEKMKKVIKPMLQK